MGGCDDFLMFFIYNTVIYSTQEKQFSDLVKARLVVEDISDCVILEDSIWIKCSWETVGGKWSKLWKSLFG